MNVHRKLSLEPETLRVESFDVATFAPEARGTVEAYQSGNNQCWTWYDRSCGPMTLCDG